MSPRKRVVETYFECFNRQDWPGMLACLTKDVERREIGDPHVVRGVAEFDRHIRPGPQVTSMRFTLVRTFEDGNLVGAEGFLLLAKKDGSTLRVEFCNLYDFEGDRIHRMTTYAIVV